MSNFGIGSLACYSNLEQIGEGTYGYVYKAKDKTNHETVALKRLAFYLLWYLSFLVDIFFSS